MIELIVIWRLSVSIGRQAAQKGLKKIPYQIMTILLWICGEVMGVIWATAVLGNNDSTLLNYGLALIGAIIGAGVAFLIMRLIPEQPTLSDSSVAIGTQDSSIIQMFGRTAWLPVLVIWWLCLVRPSLFSAACFFKTEADFPSYRQYHYFKHWIEFL